MKNLSKHFPNTSCDLKKTRLVLQRSHQPFLNKPVLISPLNDGEYLVDRGPQGLFGGRYGVQTIRESQWEALATVQEALMVLLDGFPSYEATAEQYQRARSEIETACFEIENSANDIPVIAGPESEPELPI